MTLLNCDHKIAAKSLANRLKNLPDLIGSDQAGFTKNRFTKENILLILFLDFEKGFYTLKWPFVFQTFEYLGFDLKFRELDKMFL